MAKYIKQEMPDLRKTGEQQCYYRMKSEGNITTKEFIERTCSHGGIGLSEGVMQHVLTTISDELAHYLANGYTVTLDGIGTFQATLQVKKDKEADSIDGDEQKRNAVSLEVKGVNVKSAKSLVKDVRLRCKLERAGVCRVNRSPYSKEERLKMVKTYLADETHPCIRVADYMKLTGLPKSSAARDLCHFYEMREIDFMGRGPAKVYIRKRE